MSSPRSASIQGALYLLVLSVNSIVAIQARTAGRTGRAADLGNADGAHDSCRGRPVGERPIRTRRSAAIVTCAKGLACCAAYRARLCRCLPRRPNDFHLAVFHKLKCKGGRSTRLEPAALIMARKMLFRLKRLAEALHPRGRDAA